MSRVKLVALTVMLLTWEGGALAQRQGTVQQGVQRTFSVNDLTNDKLGRIVASSEYQVSITLPGEVQNVGVNASKQAALVPTVDKSDGRVVYLDVLKPGGFASLNIRLVGAGTPIVLKMTVELSKATSGVREYTITGTLQARAAAPAPAALRGAATTPSPAPSTPTRPATTATAPARPAPNTTRPIIPAQPAPTAAALAATTTPRPVAATPAPTRPATSAGRSSPPAPPAQTPSRPPAAPVAAPTAIPPRRVAATPAPGLPATAPAATPAARGSENTFLSVQGGLRIEVTVAPGQTGATRTLTYRIADAASGDNISYILMPRATVRATAQKTPENVPLSPGTAQRVTASGAQGTATLSTASLSGFGTPVLLFEVLPVDTQAQKPLARKYVGVVVKL